MFVGVRYPFSVMHVVRVIDDVGDHCHFVSYNV